MRFTGIIGVLALTGLIAGCSGKDTGDTTATWSDTDTDTDTDTDPTGAVYFSVSGSSAYIAEGVPGNAGLCVHIIDPTNAVLGGKPEVLGTSVLAKDGTFTVENITTASTLGIMMMVQDCKVPKGGPTVFTTATGISVDDYSSVKDGTALSGYTAYIISNDYATGIADSLAVAGSKLDIYAGGLIHGNVLDGKSMPIADATITCAACEVYYGDENPMDGLYTTTGVGANSATSLAGAGLFVVPAAPITTYGVDHATETFGALTLGALPSIATVVAFVAE